MTLSRSARAGLFLSGMTAALSSTLLDLHILYGLLCLAVSFAAFWWAEARESADQT